MSHTTVRRERTGQLAEIRQLSVRPARSVPTESSVRRHDDTPALVLRTAYLLHGMGQRPGHHLDHVEHRAPFPPEAGARPLAFRLAAPIRHQVDLDPLDVLGDLSLRSCDSSDPPSRALDWAELVYRERGCRPVTDRSSGGVGAGDPVSGGVPASDRRRGAAPFSKCGPNRTRVPLAGMRPSPWLLDAHRGSDITKVIDQAGRRPGDHHTRDVRAGVGASWLVVGRLAHREGRELRFSEAPGCR